MKKTNWYIVGIISVIAHLILSWVGAMIGGGYGSSFMMRSFTPFGMFGMGLGMLFVWLIPAGLIVLAVYGVVSLSRKTETNVSPSLSSCPNCGESIQTNWQNCPHCGNAVN